MIIVRLKGGLGNQLFQYAMGRALSLKNQTPLILDISGFTKDPLRKYRLDSFRIQATTSNQFWFFPNSRIGSNLNHILHWIRKAFFTQINLVRETSFQFSEQLLDIQNNSFIDGYWQSEKYFIKISNQLRQDLCLSIPLSEQQKTLAEQISGDPSAVAVHVRRGDYLANPVTTAYHGICPASWYQHAAEYICRDVPNAHFYVFSDDYDWARDNLKLPSTSTFIIPSSNGQEAIDLHLMSLCNHNIIANSSFSWWGAWLNRNPKKIVIAPLLWFASGPQNTNDLIPSSWIRL